MAEFLLFAGKLFISGLASWATYRLMSYPSAKQKPDQDNHKDHP